MLVQRRNAFKIHDLLLHLLLLHEITKNFFYFSGFLRFLKFHKLHKYLYFFANLSFVEIQIIGESNIQTFEDKVDIFPMTTGARRAILRKLGDLNNRASRLTTMKQVFYESFDF